MSTLRSGSCRRYRVDGKVPAPDAAGFHRALTDRRFLPLAPHEERGFGWVSADNLLVTRFDADTVCRGETAAFALRIDRRRVNARLLRARLELDLDARRQATGEAGRPARLSREERQELRRHLHAELLARTNPTVEAHLVLLHPRRREVLVQSLSRAVNETLRALFRDTFGAELHPLTPWRRAGEILAGSERAADLDALERTDFAPCGAGRGVGAVRREGAAGHEREVAGLPAALAARTDAPPAAVQGDRR